MGGAAATQCFRIKLYMLSFVNKVRILSSTTPISEPDREQIQLFTNWALHGFHVTQK